MIPYGRPFSTGFHEIIRSFSGGSYGNLIPYGRSFAIGYQPILCGLRILWKSHTLWEIIFHRISRSHRLIFWRILWKSDILWELIFHRIYHPTGPSAHFLEDPVEISYLMGDHFPWGPMEPLDHFEFLEDPNHGNFIGSSGTFSVDSFVFWKGHETRVRPDLNFILPGNGQGSIHNVDIMLI
jgi:hypothetical protein